MWPPTPTFSQPNYPPGRVMSRGGLCFGCAPSRLALAKMSHTGGGHVLGQALAQQKSSKQSKRAQCHFLTPASKQQRAGEVHQALNFI